MEDAQTHFEQGQEYRKQGKLDEAIAEFKRVIELNPAHAEAHYYLGHAYDDNDMMNEAITEYKEAIKIKPDYADAHVNLGITYSIQGKLDEAIAEYKSAISINPNDANAHYNLGLAYASQGKLEQASDEYKAAISINFDDALAHNNLGNIYDDQGKLEEAIEEYKTAIKIDPMLCAAHYNLGLAYTKQGELEGAIKRFRRAIELDPSHEAAHINYVDLMKRLGRHAEVRDEYEYKAKAEPNNELWGKLLERVLAKRKWLILPCLRCIGRGAFSFFYLQFILLVGFSSSIASLASEIVSSHYLALAIYVAIFDIIYTPFALMLRINKCKKDISKIRAIDLGLPSKLIMVLLGLLVASFRFAPVAILTYAAMQIFPVNWWLPIAALGVLYRLVKSELITWKNTRKFEPVNDKILVRRLIDLIEQSNVKVKSILRMDTDELNAKVEGILQPRRILISKPVLQQFSVSEVAAVFAHELGHIKTKTMQKTFLIRAVLIFVRLYLAKVIYGLLLPIYGFSSPEQIAAFPLLAFGWLILGVFFRSIHSLISRYFEKKADQYAISVVGESSVLSSLDKILATAQRQVLSPFFNFVCRSHPCPEERLHISRQ